MWINIGSIGRSQNQITLKSQCISANQQCLLEGILFVRQYTWKSEKAMAPHSSILARKITLTGEPGALWSIVSQRVWHYWRDWVAAAAAYGNLLIGSARTFVEIQRLKKINRSLEHSKHISMQIISCIGCNRTFPTPLSPHTYTKNYF